MKSLRSLLSLLLIATSSILSVAQVYPVQATVQLTPPYSLYLADYVESGTERLVLNVFLADIARPQLDIRFRLKIIGQGITIETKPEYRPAPMSIQGGVPLRLVSTDLTDYFNASNLNFQGISRREYEQRGMLPEGVYQFCFEVLEYNRGIKVSNTACGTAWMILNDPPIINLPRQNEKLKAQSPQNVVLQWTPRHTGSPNSAFTTEYDVTLVEVWPSTRNPNDAILTSPPIFETTTGSTTVVYGPAETPLEPGRRYAFRVRARSIAGVSELDLFKNNGYSEVFTFIYGDACDLPTGIAASSIGTARFSLGWEGAFNHTGYKIRYREAGTTNWYENNVAVNAADIYSLKPATTYEYQVAATCGFFDGQYSAASRITTNPLPEAEYACGAPIGNFTLDPNQLTGSLKAGDIIQAGDFDVKLTKVNGSNGIFTGEGVIEVPYLNKAKVKVEFTSIAVNKELRMVNGSMNVTGAAVDVIPQGVMDLMDDLTETLNTIDSALVTAEENLPKQFDPDSFVADTLIDVKNGINSVYKDMDGSLVVVDNKGNEQRIPAGTSAAIKDNDGNGYLVDSKGNVHKTTADVAAKAGSREFNFALKFTANTAMRYGFDERQHDAIAKDYEQLKQGYSVPWKSVPSGGTTDVVTAIVYGTSIDKSKITFEQSGVPLQPQPFTGNQTTLSVRGGSDGIEEGLLALYSPADTGKVQVLGKLNVVAYNKLSNPVVIVPVNKTTLPSGLTPNIIEDSLNAIYSQAIADWKVSVASPIEVDLTGTFDTGETGMLSNYTDDMKKVIKAFGNLQDETYYIFLVENPSDAAILGYMPRGKQAGFVFVDRHGSNKDAFVRTIAHELGHGAYSLHHTFKEPNFSLTQGATDNLMDYPSGKKLYKYQWDKMRYPDIVVGLFEEDSEARLTKNAFFWTPSGQIMYIGSAESGVSDYKAIERKAFPNGALNGFSIDGVTYTADIRDGVFYGYVDNHGKLYKDNTAFKLSELKSHNNIAVISRIYVGNCTIVDYENQVPFAELSVIEANSEGAPIDINHYFSQTAKEVSTAVISGCPSEALDYNSLSQVGKDIYDLNKARVPEKDRGVLLKIASLGDELGLNAYSDFVFKQKNDGNMFWSVENKSVPYTLEVLQDAYNELKKFSDAIYRLKYKKYASLDELVADVRANFQVTKGSDNIFTFPSDPKFVQLLRKPFFLLSIRRKKELLDLVNNAEFTKLHNIGKDIDAGYILCVIFDASQNDALADQKELVDYIDKKHYLVHFVEDLYGFQYEIFMNSLLNMVMRSYPVPEQLNLNVEKPNFLTFDPALLQLNSENFTSSGLISLEVKKWFGDNKHTVIAKPYDYVMVEFVKDVNFGSNLAFKKGEKRKLPAVWVYQLFWDDTKAARWQTARITAEVALTVCGVGEVAIALRAVRAGRTAYGAFMAVKAVGDIGFGLTDIYLTNSSNSLTEAQMKKWNTFFVLWSVGSLSTTAIDGLASKLGKKSIDNADDWKKFDEAFPDDELNRLRDESQYAEYIDEIPTGNWNTMIGNLESHYPNVWSKIKGWSDAALQEKFVAHFGSQADVLTHLNGNNKIDDILRTWQQIATDYQNLSSSFGSLSKTNKIKFIDDFSGSSATVLRELDNDVELLDAWKEIKYLSASRTSVVFLKWVNKAKRSHLPVHLKGEVNGSGKAVGCHLQSAVDGVRVKILPNPPAVYATNGELVKAKIEIDGVTKDALSTFFPASWDEERVIEEAADILTSQAASSSSRRFTGFASDGVTEMEVRLTGPSGNLTFDTTFPK